MSSKCCRDFLRWWPRYTILDFKRIPRDSFEYPRYIEGPIHYGLLNLFFATLCVVAIIAYIIYYIRYKGISYPLKHKVKYERLIIVMAIAIIIAMVFALVGHLLIWKGIRNVNNKVLKPIKAFLEDWTDKIDDNLDSFNAYLIDLEKRLDFIQKFPDVSGIITPPSILTAAPDINKIYNKGSKDVKNWFNNFIPSAAPTLPDVGNLPFPGEGNLPDTGNFPLPDGGNLPDTGNLPLPDVGNLPLPGGGNLPDTGNLPLPDVGNLPLPGGGNLPDTGNLPLPDVSNLPDMGNLPLPDAGKLPDISNYWPGLRSITGVTGGRKGAGNLPLPDEENLPDTGNLPLPDVGNLPDTGNLPLPNAGKLPDISNYWPGLGNIPGVTGGLRRMIPTISDEQRIMAANSLRIFENEIKSGINSYTKPIKTVTQDIRMYAENMGIANKVEFWLLLTTLIYVYGILLAVAILIAFWFKKAQIFRCLRRMACCSLLFWWLIAIITTPPLLIWADVCHRPAYFFYTMADPYMHKHGHGTNPDDSSFHICKGGFVKYYLTCEGENPMMEPIRQSVVSLSNVVHSVAGKIFPNFLGLGKSALRVLDIQSTGTDAVSKLRSIKDQLYNAVTNDTCRDSSRIFNTVASEVCRPCFGGFFMIALAAPVIGFLLTAFILLSLRMDRCTRLSPKESKYYFRSTEKQKAEDISFTGERARGEGKGSFPFSSGDDDVSKKKSWETGDSRDLKESKASRTRHLYAEESEEFAEEMTPAPRALCALIFCLLCWFLYRKGL